LILRRVLAHKNSRFPTFRDELKSVPKTLVFETAKPKPKPSSKCPSVQSLERRKGEFVP
jgi:hypothetical protein